jgi:hypothetical protein
MGNCTVKACNTGFANCNAIYNDGCEVNVTNDASNCGTCGTKCVAVDGVAACISSKCTVISCNAGYADCDGVYSNGCEANLDTDSNCGGCGMVCKNATSCSGGTCI